MQHAAQLDSITELTGDSRSRHLPPLSQILAPRKLLAVLAVGATFLFFVTDLVVPRGATPAIGYALVPALAAASRRRSFIVGATAACTALTWVGYFLEPAGAEWWMSVFDRLMVCMVL